MSNMIPCQNPNLCGVQSHLPNTNALCMTKKNPGRDRAISLLASGSVKLLNFQQKKDDEALKDIYTERRIITQEMVDEGAEYAQVFEEVLKLSKDASIIAVAKTYSDNPRNMEFDTKRNLSKLGYGSAPGEEGALHNARAMAAVRIVRDEGKPGAGDQIKAARVDSLALDHYVQEYADHIRHYIDTGESNKIVPTNLELRQRMMKLGVPEDEVDDLMLPVMDKVQNNFDEVLVADFLAYPTAEIPERHPYSVSEGLFRAEARAHSAARQNSTGGSF